MGPAQKVIQFTAQQNPRMTSDRNVVRSLFDPGSLPEVPPIAESLIGDWLKDPRVRNLTSDSFRIAAYIRAGLPPPKVERMHVIRAEIRRSGLFSEQDLSRLAGAEDDLAEDVPMIRLRSCGLVPVEWNGRFTRFYKAYGMARDRGGAERAWMQLERAAKQSNIDLERVIEGATRSQREGAHRPNLVRKRPTTWLNQNCWEDEIDGGEYPATSLPLITLFNEMCPRAEKVVSYSPARSDAVRHALVRMGMDKWTLYFMACARYHYLFDFVKGEVPITTALSPEMERKVREELRKHNAASAAAPR